MLVGLPELSPRSGGDLSALPAASQGPGGAGNGTLGPGGSGGAAWVAVAVAGAVCTSKIQAAVAGIGLPRRSGTTPCRGPGLRAARPVIRKVERKREGVCVQPFWLKYVCHLARYCCSSPGVPGDCSGVKAIGTGQADPCGSSSSAGVFTDTEPPAPPRAHGCSVCDSSAASSGAASRWGGGGVFGGCCWLRWKHAPVRAFPPLWLATATAAW